MGQKVTTPVRTFQMVQGILMQVEAPPPMSYEGLYRIMDGLPKSKALYGKQLTFVGHLIDDIAIIENYYWRDGSELFNTSTQHLRLI